MHSTQGPAHAKAFLPKCHSPIARKTAKSWAFADVIRDTKGYF
jgi:hypothetical protein